MVAGEPVALLTTEIRPELELAAVGENPTLNVRLCPAESVTGVPTALRVNPAPISAMLEMVTVEFPAFVTVIVCVADDPVFTFPNARLVVLNESSCDDATPEPLKPITARLFGALLTIEMLPLTEPADAGANTALNVVDWLGLSDRGRLNALML
jgi:hypothetical protein